MKMIKMRSITYCEVEPTQTEPDQIVKDRWVEHFRQFAEQPTEENSRIFRDCGAELRRRGLEEPVNEVRESIKKIQEQIRANPDNPGLERGTAEFMKKLKDPDA